MVAAPGAARRLLPPVLACVVSAAHEKTWAVELSGELSREVAGHGPGAAPARSGKGRSPLNRAPAKLNESALGQRTKLIAAP